MPSHIVPLSPAMSTEQDLQYDKTVEIVLNFQYPDTPASLLPSNYSPGLVDRTAIETLLSSCKAVIASLTDELRINSDAADIEELQYRIAACRKYQEFQRYLISPVRKIPDEVLSRIFYYVYPGCLYIVGDGSGEFWNVLSVCAHWRNVAQSIPSFWSKFNIGYFKLIETPDGDSDSDGIPPQVTMCQLRILKCLEYSRTAPLDISIIPPGDAIPALAPAIMADITKHCDRWEVLEIDSGMVDGLNNDMIEVKSLVDARGLPKLRKLVYDASRHAQEHNYFDIFRGATALELTLRGTNNFPDCENNEFPWSNLRKISFSGCRDYEEPQYIFGESSALRDMPSLEELELDGCSICFNYDGDSEIPFLSLHTLHLGLNESSHADTPNDDFLFYPPMTIPNLTTLKLSGDIHSSGYSQITDMINDSDCKVTCLEVGLEYDKDPDDSWSALMEFIEEFHHVEELTLVQSQQRLGDILADLASNSTMLPMLKKLVVKDVSQDGDVDLAHALSDFIGSRVQGSLTQITLSVSPENQSTYKSSISRLMDLGAEVGIAVNITPLTLV